MTTIRLQVRGKIPAIELPEVSTDRSTAPFAFRKIFRNGRYVDVPVFERRELGQGRTIEGPAIIEQEDSTSWILEGWAATVDRLGNLIIAVSQLAQRRSKAELEVSEA